MLWGFCKPTVPPIVSVFHLISGKASTLIEGLGRLKIFPTPSHTIIRMTLLWILVILASCSLTLFNDNELTYLLTSTTHFPCHTMNLFISSNCSTTKNISVLFAEHDAWCHGLLELSLTYSTAPGLHPYPSILSFNETLFFLS